MSYFLIGQDRLSIDTVVGLFLTRRKIALSGEAVNRVNKCRNYLDQKLKDEGLSAPVIVEDYRLSQLQHNLLLSHACGVGDEVPVKIVMLMLLLKIQSLSFGHSGASIEAIKRLILMYNEQAYPVIYTQGSLGVSGDLAPLAHLVLPLIGEGEINDKGLKISAKEWLVQRNLSPLILKPKEGLALINGTQFTTAYGMYILLHTQQITLFTDLCGALSADAFHCRIDPFKPLSHNLRPQQGQVDTASRLYELLRDSEICNQEGKERQDPYSFRCIPQVHGASKDAIAYVMQVFDIEINAVTENPIIFPDEDEIISAGNFHGQPLAIALDLLGIALAELGSISERRTAQLVSGKRGLPRSLVKNAGVNVGLMLTQYTAAAIVSENKQLSSPCSVDSILSSNMQEDHVSMGANSATKCLRILHNVQRILAIELITAVQAMEFRRPQKSSPAIEKLISDFRKVVPSHENDRFLSPDIHTAITFIQGYKH